MIKERTKKVRLEFKRSELLYDIGQYSYVEGDVLKTDDEHDRHQIQDILQDGNIDMVTRYLDLALSKIVELLYPYTKKEIGIVCMKDDTLEETDVYGIDMLVPDDFSQTTVDYLTWLIHHLLVFYVLWHWMSLLNLSPKSKESWATKIADTESEIQGILNARIGRVRKTQTPF